MIIFATNKMDLQTMLELLVVKDSANNEVRDNAIFINLNILKTMLLRGAYTRFSKEELLDVLSNWNPTAEITTENINEVIIRLAWLFDINPDDLETVYKVGIYSPRIIKECNIGVEHYWEYDNGSFIEYLTNPTNVMDLINTFTTTLKNINVELGRSTDTLVDGALDAATRSMRVSVAGY
jgi:hypothetical protein